MIHVWQVERGDFRGNLWKGQDLRSVPYEMRPWELEAFGNQEAVAKWFFEDRFPDEFTLSAISQKTDEAFNALVKEISSHNMKKKLANVAKIAGAIGIGALNWFVMSDSDLVLVLLVFGGIIALIVANSKVATKETKSTSKVDNKKSKADGKVSLKRYKKVKTTKTKKKIFFRPKHRDVFGKPNRDQNHIRVEKSLIRKSKEKLTRRIF